MRLGVACVMLLLPMGAIGASAQESVCAKPGFSLAPVVATRKLPLYPTPSQRLGEEGATMMTVNIGTDGVPVDVTIARSSGFSRLDDVSAQHVKERFRWEPPTQDCKPASAQAPVTIVWHLGAPPKADMGLVMPATNYPPGAAEQGKFGDTYLELTLNSAGAIENGKVVYSSGYAELDEKALAVMKASPEAVVGKLRGTGIVLLRWTLPSGVPHPETMITYAQRIR